MERKPRSLPVLQENEVLKGTTCFAMHAEHGVDCQRTTCTQWIAHETSHNCVLIACQEGPHTLQKISQIYDLTRMRVHQIENGAFEKIRKME